MLPPKDWWTDRQVMYSIWDLIGWCAVGIYTFGFLIWRTLKRIENKISARN